MSEEKKLTTESGTVELEHEVYVSGGITLVDNFKEVFAAAVEKLKAQGYTKIFNPAELYLGPKATWYDYMRLCLPEVCKSHTIYMLKGWASSSGALEEHRVALNLGLKVIDEEKENVRT